MGYIDADKLIAILNDRIERCEKDEEDGYPDTTSSEATLKSILSIIISLQQEQKQYVIGGQVFGATDIEQLYEGKVYIVSNLVQDTEFGLGVRDKVKMLLIKD